MGTPITLQFTTTGNAQVQEDVDADISALNKLRQTVDLLNASEVNRFRTALEGAQQYAQSNLASELSLAQLEAMSRKFEQAVRQGQDTAGQFDNVSSKWRTGANAMSVLSLTVAGATRSMTGLTVAAGTLADAVASLSTNARVAASAAVFGALATAAAIVFAVFERSAQIMDQEKKELRQLTDEVAKFKLELQDLDFDAKLQEIDRKTTELIAAQVLKYKSFAEKAKEALHAMGESFIPKAIWDLETGNLEKLKRDWQGVPPILNSITAAIKDLGVVEKEEAEHRYSQQATKAIENSQIALLKLRNEIAATGTNLVPVVNMFDGIAKITGDLVPLQEDLETRLGREQEILQKQHLERREQLRISFDRKEGQERYLYLLQQEDQAYVAQIQKLFVELSIKQQMFDIDTRLKNIGFTTNAGEQLKAKLDQIDIEKRINALIVGNELAEKRAAAEKAAAWHAAFQAQLNDMRILEGVFVTHHHNLSRSVHEGVKNIKAIELGYIAVKDTILGLESSAWAIRYAAEGNWAAAAQEAFAATQFFAVAAKAGAEAGGGSGGGGGGAGGGGAGNQRDNTRIGATLNGVVNPLPIIEIVIVKQDETGKETARTRQRFQRLDDRNQPIRVSL